MKITFRSGYIAFVFAVLFAASATASTPEEATKQWCLNLRNALVRSQDIQVPVLSSLRSSAMSVLRLDSLVILDLESETGASVDNEKCMYYYNTYGQVISNEIFKENDINGDWILNSKRGSIYDALGHKKVDTTYQFDTETNRMYLSEVSEYRFDSDGVKLMESRKHRVGEAYPWTGDYKEEYQYDTSGRLILQLSYSFTAPSTWVQIRKKECLYDTSGYLITENQFYWDKSEVKWISLTKNDHFFDEFRRDTTLMGYKFHPLENRWTLSNKDMNQYDAGGHLMLHINYIWDEEAQRWLENSKDEYAYNAIGFKTMESSYEMDTSTMEWTPDTREEWSFDDYGNVLSQTHYVLYIVDQQWLFVMKTFYEYDMDRFSDGVLMRINPLDVSVVNLIIGGKFSLRIGAEDTYSDIGNITLYYSNMDISGVNSILKNSTLWFYNPTTKVLSFDPSITSSTVHLYDLQGRKVLSCQASNSTTLPLNELKKGLYLIRMEVNGGVQFGKLMVK